MGQAEAGGGGGEVKVFCESDRLDSAPWFPKNTELIGNMMRYIFLMLRGLILLAGMFLNDYIIFLPGFFMERMVNVFWFLNLAMFFLPRA